MIKEPVAQCFSNPPAGSDGRYHQKSTKIALFVIFFLIAHPQLILRPSVFKSNRNFRDASRVHIPAAASRPDAQAFLVDPDYCSGDYIPLVLKIDLISDFTESLDCDAGKIAQLYYVKTI